LSAYPSLEEGSVDQLFLAYTGYSLAGDGTLHYQFWETTDFLPLLTHTDASSGLVDGTMFGDYFHPQRSIREAAATAYETGMGVEVEFDLAVTYDQAKRARLLEYLQAGAIGGTDARGRSASPSRRIRCTTSFFAF